MEKKMFLGLDAFCYMKSCTVFNHAQANVI